MSIDLSLQVIGRHGKITARIINVRYIDLCMKEDNDVFCKKTQQMIFSKSSLGLCLQNMQLWFFLY